MCILLNVKKHEKTFALNVDIFRLDTVYNQLLLNPFFHVKMGAGIAMTFP